MHVLDDQPPPTRAGGKLLLDRFAFAEFFDFAALELDSRGAGFEGLDEAFVALGLVGGGGEEEGGEEEEGEEGEEEGEVVGRVLRYGHDGDGGWRARWRKGWCLRDDGFEGPRGEGREEERFLCLCVCMQGGGGHG